MNAHSTFHNGRRKGLTLVELLVVLGILAVLMGIAATAVKTGTRGKKQREAARQVNAFIAGAQARAVELNRPVGIELVRQVRDADNDGFLDAGISNTSQLMYMIETPPPYAGDTVNATMEIGVSGNTITLSDTLQHYVSLASTITTGMEPEVRLNFRGQHYTTTVVNNSPLKLEFSIPTYDNTRFMNGTQVPVQIHLPPQRSSVTPVQIPSDMCIDLAVSGIGTGNDFAIWNVRGNAPNPALVDGNEPVCFTFNPQGSLHRIYEDGRTPRRPRGNLYLLVGKYEHAVNLLGVLETTGLNDLTKVPADGGANFKEFIYPADPDLTTNLADGTAMWISVNYITGQVTTARNKLIPTDILDPSSPSLLTRDVAANIEIMTEAREFSRRIQTVRGQEDS